jgi:hypothetical protein
MKYPAAPFTVERGVEVYSADSRQIADCGGTDFTREQQQAHAQLFAAAPDLLAALEGMLNAGLFHFGQTGWPSAFLAGPVQQARAALAKVQS